jgi:hypothetical protein
MDTTTYLAAWLLAALLAIGFLSAFLARFKRQHDLRRIQAERMTQALQRYSDWLCAQRLAAVFQGEGPEAAAALDEACTIRLAWFPEMTGEMAELMAVHNRLVNFLSSQQSMWLRDPERWLASDHDKRFMALWRQHQYTRQALLARLEQATSVRFTAPPARRQSTYA